MGREVCVVISLKLCDYVFLYGVKAVRVFSAPCCCFIRAFIVEVEGVDVKPYCWLIGDVNGIELLHFCSNKYSASQRLLGGK